MPRCVRVHAAINMNAYLSKRSFSIRQEKGKNSLGFSLMHFFRVSYVNEECERENLKRRQKKGSLRFRKKLFQKLLFRGE